MSVEYLVFKIATTFIILQMIFFDLQPIGCLARKSRGDGTLMEQDNHGH